MKKAQKLTNIRYLRQVQTVNLNGSYKIDNLRFTTVNARSIKMKENLISEAIEEYKINELIINETWLQDHEGDDQQNSIQMDIKYKPSTEVTTEEEELH